MFNRFTVRIELTGSDEYTKLHEEMGNAGFTRTISWDQENVTYLLPPGEYNYTKQAETQTVLNLAKGAAQKVTADFAVLVTPAGGPRARFNLDQAK